MERSPLVLISCISCSRRSFLRIAYLTKRKNNGCKTVSMMGVPHRTLSKVAPSTPALITTQHAMTERKSTTRQSRKKCNN